MSSSLQHLAVGVFDAMRLGVDVYSLVYSAAK